MPPRPIARTTRRGPLAALLVAALLQGLAPAAAAHVALDAASPRDGDVVVIPFRERPEIAVTLTFTEELDPGRSTLRVVGPGGEVVAEGAVPGGAPRVLRVDRIPVELVTIGRYEARWTAAGADGHLERGVVTFTVEIDLGTANDTPGAPSPEDPSPGASAVPPSASAPASGPVPPAATPAPSPDPGAGGAAGGADLLVPLVVLAVVAIGGGLLVLRRRGT